MLLAAKSNGLAGDDIKPWHLKATFQLTDGSGKTTDQGTIEESWAGPQKWKRSCASTGFTQTIYGTGHGTFQIGASELPPPLITEIFADWLTPLPTETQIGKLKLEFHPVVMSGVKLTCVIATSKEGIVAADHLYCFSEAKPVLRMNTGVSPVGRAGVGPTQTVYNKTIQFQGRNLASDLQIKGEGGRLSLSSHIESLDLLPSVEEAAFTPPPDAKPSPKLVAISGNVAQGYLLRQVTPEWPSAAKDAGMSGTVVIAAVITKDGHIRDAKAVSVPKIFQGVALEAVRHWLYRPYLLNGEPVEVETTINLVFGRTPQ